MNDTSLSGAYRVFENLHGQGIHSDNLNRPHFTAQQLQVWLDKNSPDWENEYRNKDASAFRELIEKAKDASIEAAAEYATRPICSNCKRVLSDETIADVKAYLNPPVPSVGTASKAAPAAAAPEKAAATA